MSNEMDLIMKKNASSLERITSAYLGAAVGDALGWPFEGRARRTPLTDSWKGEFLTWEKKAGNLFRPYFEHVEAGEYSDDTQLILAVTRSRLKAEKWWEDFAYTELPFWTCYERGGGGATKRSATSWLGGTPPWQAKNEISFRRYLEAGGNGVAMRVLPHCVAGIRSDDFSDVALDIITDGVTTHGHPRALVGALAYGYALWYALRLSQTLEFGELVEHTIQKVKIWSELRAIESRWPSWRSTVNRHVNYDDIWDETVAEMLDLLYRARDGIKAGALGSDDQILFELGALNSKTNGAGTVTSAAAIYFASRYAASPLQGLTCSASAMGADTDTLASMSSAILGGLAGNRWLKTKSEQLQDKDYIQSCAIALYESSKINNNSDKSPVKRGTLQRLLKALAQLDSGEIITLPIGLTAKASYQQSPHQEDNLAQTQNRIRLETTEGLTLWIRGVTNKETTRSASKRTNPSSDMQKLRSEEIYGIGMSLNVRNLERSRQFYESILGLVVSGVTAKTVRFENTLAIREGELSLLPDRSITLFLNVSSVDFWHQKLLSHTSSNVGKIISRGNTKSFECFDPDGYTIEIFERQVAA